MSEHLIQSQQNHASRNIISLATAEASWGFGLALTAPGVILSVFLSELGASKAIIGCLGLVWGICQPLPQLFAGFLAGHLRQRKIVLAAGQLAAAATWLVLALYLLWIGHASKAGTIIAFFVCFAAFALTYEFMVPLWGTFAGSVLPHRRKALGFGAVFFASAVSGAVGAECARRILCLNLPATQGYALCFLLTFGIGALGCLFFLPIKDTGMERPARQRCPKRYLQTLWAAIGRNPALKSFIVGDTFCIAGVIVGQFYGVYAAEQLGMDRGAIAGLARITLVAQAASCLLLGWAADTFGCKRILIMGRGIMFVAALSLWLHGGTTAVLFTSAACGISLGAINVTWINMITHLVEPRLRTSILGAVNVVQSPAIALLPLVAGRLIDSFSYGSAFGLSAAMTGFGVAILATFVYERHQSSLTAKGALEVANAGKGV